MSDNCIFCKIAAGTIPSGKVYEDDQVYAFRDIHPQAPVHVLVIPKHHIATLDDIQQTDRQELGYLMERTTHIARLLGLAEDGYRIIINTRKHGGQEVFHIHIHILGGKPLGPMLMR